MKWPSNQANIHPSKPQKAWKCRKSTRNLKRPCTVLTPMVSFEFLVQKPSATQRPRGTWFTQTVLQQLKKTFQRAAMEYSSGRLNTVRRLCLFEGYFRQQKLQRERIKPYSMVQTLPIPFNYTAPFLWSYFLIRVWRLFFHRSPFSINSLFRLIFLIRSSNNN